MQQSHQVSPFQKAEPRHLAGVLVRQEVQLSRPLKNVGEAGKTRQKRPKKRSLRVVNEHFEAVFNAVLPTQVVFQQSVRPACGPCLQQYACAGR
ncbi:hypothetical protein EQ836_02465 [Ectopseudomonas mendocina]|uniref:Transposase n=1 Tax=Ectopseudomonas mendocina TaxID=300 RepID=A0ABD7S1I4_ECTME|nr:hypothetical protein EQ829_01075 [Pseudomonas mendocina]TRO21424.1 hypothetical protein EQ836_02465 [Pseudomonas mendocina]TRO36969.1 hypothetical protein EQ832_13470 [Pseudomonas sp. ALS1131]